MLGRVFIAALSLVLVGCGQSSYPGSGDPVKPDTLGTVVQGDGQLTEYVRRIFQDSRGHYWFGSNGDGIYRYDGTTLKVYTKKDGLAGMQITGIVEDGQGNIWIATDGGVSRYDGTKFTSYTTKDGLPSNGCWSIFIARDGTIWVGTGVGLCRSRAGAVDDALSFETVALPTTQEAGYWVSSIVQDRRGDLWFATRDAGAFRYDGSSFQWFMTKDGLADNELAGMLVDSKDDLWFGSMSGGLTHYDRRSMMVIAAPGIGGNEVWTVFQDGEGNIWFSSEGFGVYRYDGMSMKNYAARQGLGVLAVQTIQQDQSGRMWFGGGGGLYRLEGDSMVHVKRNGPW